MGTVLPQLRCAGLTQLTVAGGITSKSLAKTTIQKFQFWSCINVCSVTGCLRFETWDAFCCPQGPAAWAASSLLPGIQFRVVQRNDGDATLQGRPLRPAAAAESEHSGSVMEVQILAKWVLKVQNLFRQSSFQACYTSILWTRCWHPWLQSEEVKLLVANWVLPLMLSATFRSSEGCVCRVTVSICTATLISLARLNCHFCRNLCQALTEDRTSCQLGAALRGLSQRCLGSWLCRSQACLAECLTSHWSAAWDSAYKADMLMGSFQCCTHTFTVRITILTSHLVCLWSCKKNRTCVDYVISCSALLSSDLWVCGPRKKKFSPSVCPCVCLVFQVKRVQPSPVRN